MQYIVPETGFMRLSQVLAVFPVSKSTWYQGIIEGKFPKPVKISPRCTAWKSEDIRTLIKSFQGNDL